MIIKAEYEEQGKEGIIRLWPAPLPMDGKRLAEELLSLHSDDGEPDLNEEESRSLKRTIHSALSQAEGAISELQGTVRKLQAVRDRVK
jgi:hypothetical protein